jgi:hypothetical protein
MAMHSDKSIRKTYFHDGYLPGILLIGYAKNRIPEPAALIPNPNLEAVFRYELVKAHLLWPGLVLNAEGRIVQQ